MDRGPKVYQRKAAGRLASREPIRAPGVGARGAYLSFHYERTGNSDDLLSASCLGSGRVHYSLGLPTRRAHDGKYRWLNPRKVSAAISALRVNLVSLPLWRCQESLHW